MLLMAGRSHLAHMEGSLFEILDSMNCRMKVAINSNNHLENQNLSCQATSDIQLLTLCTSTQIQSQEQINQPTFHRCVLINLNTSTNYNSSSFISLLCPHPFVTAMLP